jgi:hypothetical protein
MDRNKNISEYNKRLEIDNQNYLNELTNIRCTLMTVENELEESCNQYKILNDLNNKLNDKIISLQNE